MESDAEFITGFEQDIITDKRPHSWKQWQRLFALARRGAAVQWRPISEAPKDGTVVLLFNGHIHRAEWDGAEWRPPNVYGGLVLGATHWMPLPPPPEKGE